MGVPLTLVARTDHDYALNAARTQLGEDAFAAAWARGQATPLQEALSAVADDELVKYCRAEGQAPNP